MTSAMCVLIQLIHRVAGPKSFMVEHGKGLMIRLHYTMDYYRDYVSIEIVGALSLCFQSVFINVDFS